MRQACGLRYALVVVVEPLEGHANTCYPCNAQECRVGHQAHQCRTERLDRRYCSLEHASQRAASLLHEVGQRRGELIVARDGLHNGVAVVAHVAVESVGLLLRTLQLLRYCLDVLLQFLALRTLTLCSAHFVVCLRCVAQLGTQLLQRPFLLLLLPDVILDLLLQGADFVTVVFLRHLANLHLLVVFLPCDRAVLQLLGQRLLTLLQGLDLCTVRPDALYGLVVADLDIQDVLLFVCSHDVRKLMR